jgi:hypothetical protein
VAPRKGESDWANSEEEMVSPESVPSTEVSGEANAPQAPVQEGITAADLAKSNEQLAQLQKQFAEFKSNASRREGELTRERDAAKKAIELGEDSEEYKRWEIEAIREDERKQSQDRVAALELENAKWRLLKDHPNVPDDVLQGAMTPADMEVRVLRWQLGARGTETQSVHPQAPQTMTSGGTGAGVGKSYEEIRDAYNKDPQANREAYMAARKARGL